MTAESRPVGILANVTKPSALSAVLPLLRFLARKRVPAVVETEVAALLAPAAREARVRIPQIAERADIARDARFIVTYGGDGTLLAAAREARGTDTPILGVNLGKLGFLADIDADDAIAAVDRVLRGEYRIEKRMTLTALLDGDRDRHHALNDVVVSKSGSARVIRVEAYVDGAFLATYYADGIIIATPTGSTAYSLATGGPIVVPSSDVLVVSPISPHTLTARPIILPASSHLFLHAATVDGGVLVMADGQTAREASASVTLTVRRGSKSLRLIKDVGPTYYDMLRRKLRWAQDHRFEAEAQRQAHSMTPTNAGYTT